MTDADFARAQVIKSLIQGYTAIINTINQMLAAAADETGGSIVPNVVKISHSTTSQSIAVPDDVLSADGTLNDYKDYLNGEITTLQAEYTAL